MKQPVHIFFFFLISLFWGGSFLAIHYAIDIWPPGFAALLRVLVGFVCLSAMMLARGFKAWRPPTPWQSFLSGFFTMGFPWICLFWGEQYISPALAAILNGLVPIFVVALTPLMTPLDYLNWSKKIGVLIGFCGVLVIFSPELSHGLTLQLQGFIAIVLMSVSYSIGLLWTRRITVKTGIKINLFYQCLGASVVLFIYIFFAERSQVHFEFDTKAILAIIYLGVFSTTFAWLMFNRIVKEVGSLQASAVTYCTPFVAILLDVFFLGKFISLVQAMGACLILSGVFLVNRSRE